MSNLNDIKWEEIFDKYNVLLFMVVWSVFLF